MTQFRTNFKDELIKLQKLVLSLASEVKLNGELLLSHLENKDNVDDLFQKIKDRDKIIDKIRLDIHEFADELLVLQQPVANDFRKIITAIKITDNYERIGDHFKKTAKRIEKITINDIQTPYEIIQMSKIAIEMLNDSIKAYETIFEDKTNNISLKDDEVDTLYKKSIKKIIGMIKIAKENEIESLSKLFFIAQSFERAADHAAKIGDLVNFAVTGERKN